MVDLDRLERSAARAAEWGRARMAVRVALVVVPMAAAGLVGGGDASTVAMLGGGLLFVSIALRFWHRQGVDAVQIGLRMGLVPFGAAILLRACGVDCDPLAGLGEGEMLCIAAGAVAGVGVNLHPAARAGSLRVWALALGVASLAASLGCVSLGIGGMLTAVLAMAAASVITAPLRGRMVRGA